MRQISLWARKELKCIGVSSTLLGAWCSKYPMQWTRQNPISLVQGSVHLCQDTAPTQSCITRALLGWRSDRLLLFLSQGRIGDRGKTQFYPAGRVQGAEWVKKGRKVHRKRDVYKMSLQIKVPEHVKRFAQKRQPTNHFRQKFTLENKKMEKSLGFVF